MHIPLGYSIDEFGDFYKKEVAHEKIQHTCDMCKILFNADHIVSKRLSYPLYNDSNLKISIRKNNITTTVPLDMCPECTEKLLELLDRHFPRLNLEDKL